MNHQFNGDPVDVPVSIRWLNPLGSAAWDTPIGEMLHSIKQPSTSVEVVSFDMTPTPSHLEYRSYEALIYEKTVAVARDSAQHGIDALIVGCFYDPALDAAREISAETVVVAPCQASIQIAVNLANRFSVIVGREKWIEQMTDRVRAYGQIDRLASMRPLGMGVVDFQADPAFTRKRIIEEAQRAVSEDRAEAIILGCTLEFGFFDAVQQAVGVPVIDPVVAAFKMAEALAKFKKQFGWKPSRVWSCEPPPEAELREFGLFHGAAPIGNLVSF